MLSKLACYFVSKVKLFARKYFEILIFFALTVKLRLKAISIANHLFLFFKIKTISIALEVHQVSHSLNNSLNPIQSKIPNR